MTKGEKFVASLPLKSAFYDRHERRAYLRFVEVAKHIVDDPTAITSGVRYIQKFIRDDPHQAAAYRLWKDVISQPPEAIARFLLEDSARGAELRDSAPVFSVVSKEFIENIWRQCDDAS